MTSSSCYASKVYNLLEGCVKGIEQLWDAMGLVSRGLLWVHSDSRKVLYLGPTREMIGTLAHTSWRWCWWWCTCKLGVCTKSLVAFEIWWAFLDTPQLGIPSNSLFDWKVPTWSLQHPTPTHLKMKESYLRLFHQHAATKWIIPEDGYLWFCYFHWPPCPLDLQIALDRTSQVQDIALVATVVGAVGAGGADDVWKKKLSCCRCYQLQGTPSLYGQYWGQEQQ